MKFYFINAGVNRFEFLSLRKAEKFGKKLSKKLINCKIKIYICQVNQAFLFDKEGNMRAYTKEYCYFINGDCYRDCIK